jgi:hypothetical protein
MRSLLAPSIIALPEHRQRPICEITSHASAFLSWLVVLSFLWFAVLGVTTHAQFNEGANVRVPGLINAPAERPRAITLPGRDKQPGPSQPLAYSPSPRHEVEGRDALSSNNAAETILQADCFVHPFSKDAKQMLALPQALGSRSALNDVVGERGG